jgi:hypothetical protein
MVESLSRLLHVVFVCFFFFCGCVALKGQYYSMGQDPASIRWKQIKTMNFQVIFPENYEEQGAYIADVLEYAYQHGGTSLGHNPRKVSVIIHNQTVASNGFVSWAPRRIEMFTNPPQDIDSHGWLESLAIHEFRHIVQIDKLNQGITRLLSYLFGEQATGAVLGLFVPMWFMEGDAVATETALTNAGRGRLPSFEQGLRAQLLEKGMYSFDKAVLGSMKDHVPNYYELGYQLVASARKHYGSEIWDKALTNVGRKPYTLFPLTFGLKKYAGVSKIQHYKNTMCMLDSAWSDQRERYDYSAFEKVNPDKKLFTSYRYPAFINDTTLMALKTGMGSIPAVVSLGLDGSEAVLFRPGPLQSHPISTNGEVIVWSEFRRDPRWEHRSWSEVYRYDIKTGIKQQLTRHTRYFSPSISADSRLIVVAEVTDQNQYSIVVIDAMSGDFIRRYKSPENDFLMTPSWHQNNYTIIAVALDERGKRLVVTDKELGGFTTVFHAGFTEISRPRFFSPDGIFFNGAFSGIDNVYALDIPTGDIYMATSSEFGALDAVLTTDGASLLWSDYSSMGYDVVKGTVAAGSAPMLDDVADHSLKMYEVLVMQEEGLATRDSIPRMNYVSIPYDKMGNLFSFHSWGPIALDVDNLEGNPGFSLLSQNKLSTSFANIGYAYDLNEGLGKYYLKYSYEGLYPVVDLVAETALRRSYYRSSQNALLPFLFRENNWKLGFNVPLSFQKGICQMGLRPSAYMGFTQVASIAESPDFFRNNNIRTLEYRLFAFRQQRTVARDIRTRWGQVMDISYRHTPISGSDMGEVFATRLALFFPGMLPHHSLRLIGSFQKRREGERLNQTINYTFSNQVVYPRGITGRSDDQATIFSADYAFPIIYPDWRIPHLVFIKRVSSNIFYDYAYVRYSQQPSSGEIRKLEGSLNSMGIDLLAHMHLFRFFFPIDLGVRAYIPSDQGSLQFQFLWSVSF